MRTIPLTTLLAFLTTIATGADLVPVIEVGTGFLIGSTRQGQWLKAENAGKGLVGGEEYRLYSATKLIGTTKGGKPKSEEEVCPDVLKVPLKKSGADAVIAIGGDWNALPRTPEFTSTTQPVYENAALQFLISKGI